MNTESDMVTLPSQSENTAGVCQIIPHLFLTITVWWIYPTRNPTSADFSPHSSWAAQASSGGKFSLKWSWTSSVNLMTVYQARATVKIGLLSAVWPLWSWAYTQNGTLGIEQHRGCAMFRVMLGCVDSQKMIKKNSVEQSISCNFCCGFITSKPQCIWSSCVHFLVCMWDCNGAITQDICIFPSLKSPFCSEEFQFCFPICGICSQAFFHPNGTSLLPFCSVWVKIHSYSCPMFISFHKAQIDCVWHVWAAARKLATKRRDL